MFRTIDPGATSSSGGGGSAGFWASIVDFLPGSGAPTSSSTDSLSGMMPYEESAAAGDIGDEESSATNVMEMGASILPAILLVVCVLLLIASFFTSEISGTLHSAFSKQQNQMVPGAIVWASKDSGTYYCGDSMLYGKSSGDFMKQSDALSMGYQPSLGLYCHESGPENLARRKPRSRRNRGSTADGDTEGKKSDISAPPLR